MTVYQIYRGNEIGEDIFEMSGFEGVSEQVTKKLYKGIKRLTSPQKECIPFFVRNKFAFVNLNALKYFLFGLCEMDYEDIDELKLVGYNVLKIDVDCYTSGLSKILCTFDLDEVLGHEVYPYNTLLNNISFCIPESHKINKSYIDYAYQQYYKDNKDVYRYNSICRLD
jgi:hypothetical protein